MRRKTLNDASSNNYIIGGVRFIKIFISWSNGI